MSLQLDSLVTDLIFQATAAIDQKTLTGESRPVVRGVGEAVLAATVVADGKIYVRATAVGGATRAGWIVQALRDAPVHDMRAANYASRFANRLVLQTFALAGSSNIVSTARSTNRTSSID